jgi:hypothetical protein
MEQKKSFQYVANKMQRYTVYYIWKLLYMFVYIQGGAKEVIPICSQQDATLQSLLYLETGLHVCVYTEWSKRSHSNM